MTLLVSANELEVRRKVAGGPLRSLATSLAADLSEVIARPLYVPDQKALLTREGGRCLRDGTMLDFDPLAPHAHKCPRCGEVFTGELHDRFWVYWYQLWLAERAVHGALLGALGVEPRGIAFASSVLEAYCVRYPQYPNVDNALGPTRPFFSTYLESIWLLQLCVAVDLIQGSGEGRDLAAVVGRFCDRVVEPSLMLIRSYDEGMSNRQVWNNAAMMAAYRVLGRIEEAEAVVWSESGLAMHLSEALLSDGMWYEGENYHLFAHRGLWYGVTMAVRAGVEIQPELVERFQTGYAAPFLTALPDFTLPSRRDSQYAISLRQWRFAEVCELGLASGPPASRTLLSVLSHLYSDDIPRADTGRMRSSAEVERNMPPSALTRADLGWRSLLFARPELPPLTPAPLPSVLLEAQGIGVLRRDAGQVYAALDYGHSGGGHGHPDRLNLLLMRGKTRWLDDFGTGSYVDPSLHWYRSTLAHNAPLIDGRSQQRTSGSLDAYEDRGAAGWLAASARITPNAVVRRTLVAMPDYLVDEFRWHAQGSRFTDLPLHVDASPDNSPSPAPAPLEGGDGVEDGFRFLRDTGRIATVVGAEPVHLRGTKGGDAIELWVSGDHPLEIWRVTAPAAPGKGDESFIIIRSAWATGTIRTVWSWSGAVASASLFPMIAVTTREGRHEHKATEHGWNVAMYVGGARSTLDLGGLVPSEATGGEPAPSDEDEPRRAIVLKPNHAVRVSLGGESYRRSEETWGEAGSPSAEIDFENENGELVIEVAVTNADRTFVPADATNRLDNENADVNGAGIQLYLRTDDASAGYVLVPSVMDDSVHARPIDGWGSNIPVQATWTGTDDGYVVEIHVDVARAASGTVIDLDVIVNEKPPNRERRRGQLVLSGAAGEFVYLRGDRHDPDRLIPMLLTDV
jgi:Heparinase II/III-like protein